ncbi:MAG: glycosyltransferase, partial [Verrucomicrobiales bacterium]
MKKILVFTAGFGEGHNTAARNIRDAIEMVAPDEARVEILDLFDECYGKFNDWMRKAYLTAINRAPRVWGKIYDLMDNTGVVKQNLSMLKKMRGTMSDLLLRVQPDAVVSTYPAYNYLIDSIFQEGRQRQFSQITVVTDSITINSVWHRCGSDYFLVPNEPTAEVMIRAGVEEERIKVFGFPVTPQFCDPQMQGQRLPPSAQEPRRVLYMVNSGKKEAHRIVRKLLKEPSLHLTVTAGRDTALRQRIDHEIKDHCDRASVLGWTNKMPELLMSHHLVISKAGGATVQEAIAARTPMIISQVVPGQEEGNARLLLEQQAAILAPDADAVVDAVQDIFAKDNRAWHGFYEQISKLSRPSASLDIARFILEKALPDNTPPRTLPAFDRQQEGSASSQSGLLLCD